MQKTVQQLITKKSSPGAENMLLDIFARIWAFWGMVSFVVTFLIIFIPSMFSYFFPEKRGQDYFIWVSRCWISIWLRLIGCPVTVNGLENFKPGNTYVIVYNHNAFLDVPLSAPFVPGGNKTIAKASFTKVPIFSFFYKRGSVLVDRKDNASRVKSFEEMKSVLQKGMHMCIYPEGTRNRTTEPLKAFHDGAFKLAVEANNDILPCVIVGTQKAMPIHKKFYLLPTRLYMHFLPAVSVESQSAQSLKETVFDLMKNKFVSETGNQG